jgi:hypothetical protein
VTDQGYDPVYDRLDDLLDYEPDEPPCWCSWDEFCWFCVLPPARVRRQQKRRWRQDRQRWRKIQRHANDRCWQARNRPAFDDEAPF